MRQRYLTFTFSLSLLVGAPAAALDVWGNAGGAYMQNDTWGAVHTQSPFLQGTGHVDANGELLDPGQLDLASSLHYGESGRPGSTGQQWGGALNVLTLSRWLPVQLFADRTWGNFSSDSAGRTGTTLSTGLGASAQTLMQQYRPLFYAGVGQNEMHNYAIDGKVIDSISRSLNTGITMSLPRLAYSARYGYGWNEGTLTPSNYGSHQVGIASQYALSERTTGVFTGDYYIREPSRADPLNPRISSGNFAVSTVYRTETSANSLGYSYGDSSIRPFGGEARSSTSNGVDESYSWPVSRDVALSLGGNASAVASAVGTNVERSAGQSASLGGGWHHGYDAFRMGVSGSASGGVLEAKGGVQPAFGGQGSVSCSRPFASAEGSLSYSIGYGQNLKGVVQTTFAQSLMAGGSWKTSLAQLSGNLSFMAQRSDNAVFGTAANRSLTADVTARLRTFSLSAQGGIVDGLSPELSSPVGDGLFIPLSYNSHRRYANARFGTGGGSGYWGWTFGALANATQASDLGATAQHQEDLAINLGFSFGAWAISISDDYAIGGPDGGPTYRSNGFFVSLTRGFRAKF